jgi:hypothetical protein
MNHWVEISMDFIQALPRTPNRNDSIWVLVDRLTKFAHFIPIKKTFALEKLAKIYIKEIVSLHGVPLSIVSDPHFIVKIWEGLHKALGSKLYFSMAYHP